MANEVFGYKEILKVLVEYQIALLERYKDDKYDIHFSLLLISLPDRSEKELRESVLPVLRKSDRIFYVDGKLIAFLPETDWNGAQKVHKTITETLGLGDVEDCVVEYPTDGSNAFTLISNLYAKLDDR